MRIKEGFIGSRLVVVPLHILQNSLQNSLVNGLVIHSIGFYPNAKYHYFEREYGCGEYILIYCTNGEGWVEINGIQSAISTGRHIVIPADVPHKYSASDSNPWSIYWVHFKGEKSKEFYNLLSNVNTLDLDSLCRIQDRKQHFDELINILDGEVNAQKHEYSSLALNQLLASFIYPDSYREATQVNIGSKSTSFINLAWHFMQENIDKKMSLKDISSHFGYSESYFYRLFHAQVGCSPISYFLQLKIDRSCHLLTTTTLKINQISNRIGFESPLYFSKYFKIVVGVSPKEYRQNPFAITFKRAEV